MAPLTTPRMATIDLALGGDRLRLESFEAVERLSQPFEISVVVLAPAGEIDFLPHFGKAATIEVVDEDGTHLRYFHGLLFEAELIEEIRAGIRYRLTLRPWLYLLMHRLNYAIFQDQTAVDILHAVFEGAGCTDVDYTRLQGQFATRSYCVQYRETDHDFLMRLIEEEGIFFSFEHHADRHVLTLFDTPSYDAIAGRSTIAFTPGTQTLGGWQNRMWQWRERISSDARRTVTLRDFDFERPTRRVEQSHSLPAAHRDDRVEVYDYPGGFVQDEQGRRLSRIQLEAIRAERRVYAGECDVATAACGRSFTLHDHPVARLNTDYAIIGLRYSLRSEHYRSGGSAPDEPPMRIAIEAVQRSDVWRTPVHTAKPVARGPETAIVTGPRGGLGHNQDIYTDKYGRVKVRFHWDRSGIDDERSSCWLRVSQTGGLGNIILPRIGHEVVVDFLDGDPDRPIVIGRVFNADYMPVYSLPEHQTRAVWRSHTSGGSGSYGNAKPLDSGAPRANEIRFEDKGGKEEFYVHAERDMNTRIRHDETHHVGQNQSVMIGYDHVEDVGHDETISIGNNRAETVGNNETISIGNNRDETVGNNETISIGNNREVSIGATDTLKVGQSLKIEAGTTIDIRAGAKITLTVGSSTVTMTPAMVKIEAPIIQTEAKIMTNKGTLHKEEADAMMIVKGAITMIN